MNKKIIAIIIILVLFGLFWWFVKGKGGLTILPGQPADQTDFSSVNDFTLAEVALHDDKASCYSAIRGSVYDLTSWIGQHPGGEQGILSICGKDGTSAFVNQNGGMERQERELEGFKIGELKQ